VYDAHRTHAPHTHTSAKALPRPAACGEWSTSAGTLRAALPYSSSRRQKIHPGYRGEERWCIVFFRQRRRRIFSFKESTY